MCSSKGLYATQNNTNTTCDKRINESALRTYTYSLPCLRLSRLFTQNHDFGKTERKSVNLSTRQTLIINIIKTVEMLICRYFSCIRVPTCIPINPLRKHAHAIYRDFLSCKK